MGFIDSFSLSSNNNLIYFSIFGKGLSIADAKNPKQVKTLGTIQPFEYQINDWLGEFVVSADDRIAFLTNTHNADMVSLDVSNPKKIQNLGPVQRYDIPGLNEVIGSLKSLQWKGNKLYINWGHVYVSGITVLNVETPTILNIISEIKTKTQVDRADFEAPYTDFSEFAVSSDEQTIFVAAHYTKHNGHPVDLPINGLDIYSRR